MAVLTPIAQETAGALLAFYGIAGPFAIHGVPAGSVNSNFCLVVGDARFFLRIYEERDAQGARRETAMLDRLAAAGVPTPPPLRRKDGEQVSLVFGKPAALFPWRDGEMRCQASVGPEDARRIGAALAAVHVASSEEAAEPGRFEYEDLLLRIDRIAASRDPLSKRAPALRDALVQAVEARDVQLPQGLIHGDLFRDNVLWDSQGEIAALLDFESACLGKYAYDLMVCVLSWCFGDGLDLPLARAMVDGYESVRPLSRAERRGLWVEGSFAALRFTITRITDYSLREGVAGPRVVKSWARFWARYEALQALGSERLSAALTGTEVG